MTAWGHHYSIGGNKTGSGQFIERLNAAGIPVCMKGVGDAGLCFEAQESGKRHGVTNVLAYRVTNDDTYQYDTPRYDMPPSEAARLHFDKTAVRWPAELDKALVWSEVVNEPRAKLEPNETTPTWGGMHPVAWLGRFMVEYAQIAKNSGFKVCGPSFASGDPEIDLWQLEGMADWLRYCADNPDTAALSVHEYCYAGLVPFEENYPWHYGRFQAILAAADTLGIPRTFNIIVTEFGWKYDWVPTFEAAAPVLESYGRLCAAFPQVKGIALWTLQDGWGGISDRLAQWITPDGNPFANWVINNQYPTLDQPQPTAPEFGATLPTQPPDGGGEQEMELKWLRKLDDVQFFPTHSEATHLQVSFIQKQPGQPEGAAVKYDLVIPPGTGILRIHEMKEVPEEPTDPNPPQPKPYLEVEALGQRDPRWANVTLGQPTGHGKTIGNWGCLLTAYNCLARYWGLTTRLPDAENAHYVSMGAFSAQYIQPAALRTAYPDSVAYDGYLTRDSEAMRAKIRQWVDDGWPVPCRVDFNPATAQWDQHWVLVIGYIGDTDFYMMDPWHGDIAIVNSRYAIAGSDILEAIFYRPEAVVKPLDPPTGATIDLLPYMMGTHKQQHTLQYTWGGGGTHGVQNMHSGNEWKIVKGNSGEYENLYYDDTWIYRAEDTSESPERFYTQSTNGTLGAAWIKRHMAVGEVCYTTKQVQHYLKAGCVPQNGGLVTDKLTLEAIYATFTFDSGITLPDVAFITWAAGEGYFFAKGYGLVGFKFSGGKSYISELALQGRPDLPINKPGCIDLNGRFYA